jgi:dihydropteroate synthase
VHETEGVTATPQHVVAGLPQPGRCLVMGIVNVTPDSFSDGGQWLESASAIEHGLDLVHGGADLVDVGGESTRPGAIRPSVDEELARVIPVVEALSDAGALVSIDTMRSEVARLAVAAGAVVVNDVSGGLADPEMLAVVAELDVAYICMHWRGHSTTMQDLATYIDVIDDVRTELGTRVGAIREAGIDLAKVAVDPGLGFAKNADHNWTLLGRLPELHQLNLPLVVGASRKAFLGALLATDAGPRIPAERDDATTATTVIAAMQGAWCVRVHDARRSRDAVDVTSRWAEELAR